jgi:response regulator RpfG family c-di-GMP phosphodiesterase
MSDRAYIIRNMKRLKQIWSREDESAEPETMQATEEGKSLPKVKVPLRTKITLPYIGLALLIAFGAALILTKIVFDTVEERFSIQLVEVGRLASEKMVSEEKQLLSSLRLISFTEGVGDALQSGDATRLRNLTFGLIVNRREEAVEFLDPRGNTVLSMKHIPGGNAEDYYSTGGDRFFSEWDIVTQIMKNKTDNLGDKYSGWTETSIGKVFYVSGPVLDEQGRLMGILLVGRTLDSIVREMREETLAQITIYSSYGKPLASTLQNAPPVEPVVIQQILTNQDANNTKRDPGPRRALNSSNVDYAELLGPWEGRGQSDIGILGVSLSNYLLVDASRATRDQILVLTTLATLLVLLIGRNLANLITRPLSQLLSATRAVERGEVGVNVEVNTRDELELLANSFNQMVASLDQSKAELLQAYDTTLVGWSRTIELRDEEVLGHTSRAAQMAKDFAGSVGVHGNELMDIWRGSLLHDIGEIGIPDAILHKPDRLTEDQWYTMRQHPQMAHDFLKDIKFLEQSLLIPLHHHERWDGSGYPSGLNGEEIPLGARIFALVDAWDAMTSERPYRPSLSKEDALKQIIDDRGTHFDPALTDSFVEFIKPFMTEAD